MGDASERLDYEMDAIESPLQKMRTYTTEKNAMIMYLSELIRDVRCLHERLQAKPITKSTETQTDPPEPLTNVSEIRKYLNDFFLVTIVFINVVVRST